MRAPSPRYTRHAHAERARKRIVFTHTGARVNELRNVTYNDLMGVIQEGPLKLVLHKQKDAIVRVLATVGQDEVKKLTDLFFNQQRYKFLGESYKKPGEVMHEKAWINKEIKSFSRLMMSFPHIPSLSSLCMQRERVKTVSPSLSSLCMQREREKSVL
jgi:hypothetical protein